MKALIIEQFGGPEVMKFADVPQPPLQSGEVEISVVSAGINPVDWKIREGMLKERIPHTFPIVLGWDVAGVITKCAPDVKHLHEGDEVFAYIRKPMVQWGSFAEFTYFQGKFVIPKPENLSFTQAASVPLSALTAWQTIHEALHLKAGQTILIHAGAGGVGSFAIQFAKQIGAEVITTANSKNHSYVKQLGADMAIDYTKENVEKKIKEKYLKGIDAVFDTIGGKTLESSYTVIKPQGSLASIVTPLTAEDGKKHHVKTSYVFVRPETGHLSEIAQLLRREKIKVPEIHSYSFDQATQAVEDVKKGHMRGKAVLNIG